MKKKVTLIEYLNYVNGDGTPIGHGKKVFHQMADLLSADFQVECVASKAYLPSGSTRGAESVNPICQAGKTIKSVNREVFGNLRKCIAALNAADDVVWFTNADWHLFAFLSFLPIKKKIVVTVYRDVKKDVAASKSKLAFIKKYLVNRGIGKVDLFVVSNPHLAISSTQVFIPDYVYNSFYEQYRGLTKKDRIVCVGAMRDSKDLRGVVSHFSNTDVEVMIVGGFADKEEYEWLKNHKTDNISIEDRIVPYVEYNRMIAESKYVIIPYKMEAYATATSGILQEAMFLQSIPIAPQELLTYNGVNGIGYKSLSELPSSWAQIEKVAENVSFDVSVYEESHVRNEIVKAMNCIM